MAAKISNPPQKPLLIYDGECRFCCYWIERLRPAFDRAVAIGPSQEKRHEFPEIEAAAWDRSIQLIEPDGKVFERAEAAFRVLAHGGKAHWLRRYQGWAWFRWLTDRLYRLVAANRPLFSRMTEVFVTRRRVECPPGANNVAKPTQG